MNKLKGLINWTLFLGIFLGLLIGAWQPQIANTVAGGTASVVSGAIDMFTNSVGG